MTAVGFAERLSLSGKRALVTGGGGGIGGAVIEYLMAAGADVASADLPDRPPPAGCAPLTCDLSDVSAIETLAEELGRGQERLDILVHACGITRDARLWKLSSSDWTDVMRVNLDSAFHLLRCLNAQLRSARSASVVLITSINGERGKIGQANYAASKGGLIALGKTAARELGIFGIRVNLVAPGLIRTAMTEDLPPEIVEGAVAETVLGRAGDPQDVAAAVLFLCSAMSRHVTGQVLRVDGGQLIA